MGPAIGDDGDTGTNSRACTLSRNGVDEQPPLLPDADALLVELSQ
jgi:hypothetical protein